MFQDNLTEEEYKKLIWVIEGSQYGAQVVRTIIFGVVLMAIFICVTVKYI